MYAIRVRDEMFVSNSIACVLVRSGEELDRSYRDYFFDVLDGYRAGISRPFNSIPTRGGKRVVFHTCANIVVTADLVARRVETGAGAAARLRHPRRSPRPDDRVDRERRAPGAGRRYGRSRPSRQATIRPRLPSSRCAMGARRP